MAQAMSSAYRDEVDLNKSQKFVRILEALQELLGFLDLDLLLQFLESLLDFGLLLRGELVLVLDRLVQALLSLDDQLVLCDCCEHETRLSGPYSSAAARAEASPAPYS